MKIDPNKIAEDITFTQLRQLIGKTVQLGWLEFQESYSNEVGDWVNYKNVFLEELDEDMGELDEPTKE